MITTCASESRAIQGRHKASRPRQDSQGVKPKLVLSSSWLPHIIEEKRTEKQLLVADSHNFNSVRSFDGAILIEEASEADLIRVRSFGNYDGVIAVGGCSALDFGRACAAQEHEFVAIPSILSTSCISVDRSVIYRDGFPMRLKTAAPREVIISAPLLLSGDPTVVARWSHSGFGDLFSNISAAIDYLFMNGDEVHANRVRDLVPGAFEALDWVLDSFSEFDESTLERLAGYLHQASLDVILRGTTELSAAGEHDLYYAMQQRQHYSRKNPTHGELVSIGTLISCRGLGELLGNQDLFGKIKGAFFKLGLPVDYYSLRRISVEREHLIAGLQTIEGLPKSFLSWIINKMGLGIVDECYR